MKTSNLKYFSLAVLSGLLLCLPWVISGSGVAVFLGFVPLMIVASDLVEKNKVNSTLKFTIFALVSMFIWNAASLWWLANASLVAAIAVIVVYTLLMTSVLIWIFTIYKRFGRNTALIFFIPLWISFEYLMMQTQISRPWINLGNAFANNITLIQWYEYTGIFGGSLWVLVINMLIFYIYDESRNARLQFKQVYKFASLVIIIFLPILFSVVKYSTYREKSSPVRIAILQPNINSYTEKYSTPIRDQLNIILTLANQTKDYHPDYFIAPETSIPIGISEDVLSNHFTVEILRDFLVQSPNAEFIIGATTKIVLPKGNGKTIISQPLGTSGDYYDLYNSALQIDTSNNVDIYHKSELVPGVEFLPYPEVLGVIENLLPDFGGLPGSHGTQAEREIFIHNKKDIKAGVPVCYESVYGDCIAEFVKCGAEVLLIITNDGWWGDTQGYRQHNSLSSLRAIETRRSIARCANTGISCFINQRGDVLSFLGWNERGFITGEINANDKLTFYVKNGDYIARIFTAISLVLNLLIIGSIIKKRFAKN
jgi:apolipoprotein N-acyltransferase